MIKIIVVFDIITSKEIIYVIDIFDIHDILDMIDPIEIIIICISDNIYIIDAIYSLDIIETSIDVITDDEINDDVNNVNDFDHIYQTRQLTELINRVISLVSDLWAHQTTYSANYLKWFFTKKIFWEMFPWTEIKIQSFREQSSKKGVILIGFQKFFYVVNGHENYQQLQKVINNFKKLSIIPSYMARAQKLCTYIR